MGNQGGIHRMNGKPLSNKGVKADTYHTLLTAGQSVYLPADERLITRLISNTGSDASGTVGGDLLVRTTPNFNPDLTGSNGHVLKTGGSIQFDSELPWSGSVQVTAPLAQAYVCVTELYDIG